LWRLGLIAVLARLRRVEPARDAEALAAVLALADDDLLDGVEGAAGLDLEEDELVPARRDGLGGHRRGLRRAAWSVDHGVEFERAAPGRLPELEVGERHVEDVRYASRADDIVVVQQMAALFVCVYLEKTGKVIEQ
jgi:hypothetical protein